MDSNELDQENTIGIERFEKNFSKNQNKRKVLKAPDRK
jgi:hypothetical protein